MDSERQKNIKECISISGGTIVKLAPRPVNAPGMAAAENDNNFDMERAYLLDSVDVEQRLFGELIRPLVDRYMVGFNATVWHWYLSFPSHPDNTVLKVTSPLCV